MNMPTEPKSSYMKAVARTSGDKEPTEDPWKKEWWWEYMREDEQGHISVIHIQGLLAESRRRTLDEVESIVNKAFAIENLPTRIEHRDVWQEATNLISQRLESMKKQKLS